MYFGDTALACNEEAMEPKIRKPRVNMIEVRIPDKTDTRELVEVSLTRFVGYFLRLGTFGFGGPIALAGHMQQDLVEERRWISKQDYVEGLALAQLAPRPFGRPTRNLSWLCP